MSIKSLLAAAAMAAMMLGFASSAMAATDGVMRDVVNSTIIPENTELHFIGSTGWFDASGNGMECHRTFVIQIKGTTGTTGIVTKIATPDTTACTAKGTFGGCKIKSHQTTNLPYDVTATAPSVSVPAGDLDVTGEMSTHTNLEGFLCPAEVTYTFGSLTLKPLKTGTLVTTGTEGRLGTTSVLNEPIAGVEISGAGWAGTSGLGSVELSISGNFELTAPDRCTWKITAS